MTPSTVLMISPTVLNIPHSTQDNPHSTHGIPHGTQDIPHIYHHIPHGTEHPHGTQDIPHGTEHPPRYCTHIIQGVSTRLYDKLDDFDFHTVNFPFLSSNIPSGPSYGVYISQLIRYACCCLNYDDFRYHHKCLVDRLLSQGYIALRLQKSFKKFYARYQDLIEKYQRSVKVMVND